MTSLSVWPGQDDAGGARNACGFACLADWLASLEADSGW